MLNIFELLEMALLKSHPVGYAIFIGICFVLFLMSVYHVGNWESVNIDSLKQKAGMKG